MPTATRFPFLSGLIATSPTFAAALTPGRVSTAPLAYAHACKMAHSPRYVHRRSQEDLAAARCHCRYPPKLSQKGRTHPSCLGYLVFHWSWDSRWSLFKRHISISSGNDRAMAYPRSRHPSLTRPQATCDGLAWRSFF